MPYLPEQREYRMMPLMESKAEGEENNYTVEGYATTFDDAYLLFNWEGTDYFETIDRNAIDENTIMDDVIFQYDHEGMVYARMHNGTLKLSVDDHGLKIVADLSKTADARNMYENIVSGNVYQMSWAFVVDSDEFDKDTHTRHIKHVKKVYDTSAVSIPANPSTEIYSVAQRRIEGVLDELRKESAEREKKIKTLKILLEAHKK